METKEIEKVNPNPAALLEMAIEKGADIDQLSKLMDLQERWNAQQAKKAFLEAMAKFQSQKPEITKSTEGYNYKYATLNQIQKQVDPVLSECGLSYRWEQEIKDGKIKVSCIASHLDGHSERTSLEATFDTSGSKNEIQAMGSSNTYLERYTFCGLFAISSNEDDDGKGSDDDLVTVTREAILACKTKKDLNEMYEKLDPKLKVNKSLQKNFKAKENGFKAKAKL